MIRRLSAALVVAALLFVFAVAPPGRAHGQTESVSLYIGLNEVVWTGASQNIATALAGQPVTAVFQWNNATQRWSTWRAGLPSSVNSLVRFETWTVYWLQATSPSALLIAEGRSTGRGGIPEGISIVGEDIEPGTYTITPPADGSCYWTRLSGFSGEARDFITGGGGYGQIVVTIAPTDAGFELTCFDF